MKTLRTVVVVGVALAIALVVAYRVQPIRERLSPIRDRLSDNVTRFISFALVESLATKAEWADGRPAPTPKRVAQSAVIGGKLYVFGGFAGPVTSEEAFEPMVSVYDPVADTWARAADVPLDVTHCNAVVVDGTVWIVGGFRGGRPGPPSAKALRYDVASDSWSEGPPLPVPTAGGTLALVGRTLYYVGGFTDRDTTVDTHWALAVDGGGTTWQRRAPIPVARGHVASAVVGDRIYVIGGQRNHDTDPVDLDAVHAYDPARDAWTALASLPGPRSHFESATFVHHDRIFVVGGRNNQRWRGLSRMALANVTAYDPATNTWTELPTLPTGLQTTVAQVVGDRLIVTNGASGEGDRGETRTLIAAAP